MKFKKDAWQDTAVVTINRERYVFEDGEIWWRYRSEYTDPYTGRVKPDSWVVNSKTGQSRQSELDRKIVGEQ